MSILHYIVGHPADVQRIREFLGVCVWEGGWGDLTHLVTRVESGRERNRSVFLIQQYIHNF